MFTELGEPNHLVRQSVRPAISRTALTHWPGLQDLYEDLDLKVTIDYRDVLSEIVQNRLGNPDLAAVFPNYTPNFQGVTTP